MTTPHPARIQALRAELIRLVPKVPNNRDTIAHMQAMGSHHLMLIYLTWRMRLIPPKPRAVRVWSGGVDPLLFATLRPELAPLLGRAERGQDLTPHLSNLVGTLGFAMPQVAAASRWFEKDFVLIKAGLHHFHVGPVTAANPTGRSHRLVFAEVTDDEFRVLAISDHSAFTTGSAEMQRLFGISRQYIQSQVPPGQGFMAYPTMSSGHPMELVLYADRCDEYMKAVEPKLDDSTFVDTLYAGKDAATGLDIERPKRPNLKWHFEDRDFGLLERKNGVFFRVYSSPR